MPAAEIGTVVLFTVEASIASLNVSTTVLLTVTPVAPLVGLTLVIDGVVVFAVPEEPVAKLLVKGVTEFPA